jgi:pimeloyl-ACP methyl ester carboxylesterase
MVSWLANEQFDSVDKIGRVDAPILMMHGSADDTVPVTLGRRLRDAAPAGTRWVEFSGGSHSRLHSEDPALYREAVKSLIARLGASSSAASAASP